MNNLHFHIDCSVSNTGTPQVLFGPNQIFHTEIFQTLFIFKRQLNKARLNLLSDQLEARVNTILFYRTPLSSFTSAQLRVDI